MAPEITNREQYRAIDADLFATAVMLFVMKNRTYPWNSTSDQDPEYRFWSHHQMEDWWEKVRAAHGPDYQFDNDFVDLLSSMFAKEVSTRLTLADFVAHPWVMGPSLS